MWYNDSNIDKRDCIPATTQLKIHPRATKRAGSPREEWHQYDMHVIANARAQGIIELSNHTTWSRSEKMTTSSIPGMLVGPGNRVYSSPVLLHHSNKSDFFAQKPLNLTRKVNTIDQEYSLMHKTHKTNTSRTIQTGKRWGLLTPNAAQRVKATQRCATKATSIRSQGSIHSPHLASTAEI